MTITQPEAARLLSDPDKLTLLCPFFEGEHTTQEVAVHLGLTLNAAYLQVRRFHTAGLLRVVREVPRAGRAVKVYRASARAFFVPLQRLEGETRATLLERVTRTWEAKLVRGLLEAEPLDERRCGVRVALGDEGKLMSSFVASPDGDRSDRLEPEAPAVFDTWMSVRLSAETAKALQRELAALSLKYRKLFDDERGKPYVVRLAMAPHAKDGMR